MPSHSSIILLIEESPGECELFRLALTQTGFDVTLYTEHDAEAASIFLRTGRTTPNGPSKLARLLPQRVA